MNGTDKRATFASKQMRLTCYQYEYCILSLSPNTALPESAVARRDVGTDEATGLARTKQLGRDRARERAKLVLSGC